MMFCSKCGAIIIPAKGKKTVACAKCGYRIKQQKGGDIIVKEKLDKKDTIEVIDKKVDTLPKVDEECPECGNKKAFYWTLQTRASDEAQTRFFECVKCKHRWRRYN